MPHFVWTSDDEKMPMSHPTFFVPNFLDHCMVFNTFSFRVFFLTYQQFFDHFSSIIFRNLQMTIHDKKTKQARKRKQSKHLKFFSQNVSYEETLIFLFPFNICFFSLPLSLFSNLNGQRIFDTNIFSKNLSLKPFEEVPFVRSIFSFNAFS